MVKNFNIEKLAVGDFNLSSKGPKSTSNINTGAGKNPNQSSVSQQQIKYPEATNAVHLMQQTLGTVSGKLAGKYRDVGIEGNKEKLQLIYQFGLTQVARELQSTDDGVWGQNTKKALENVQKYIATYHQDKNLGKLEVGPYLLSKVDVNAIVDAVQKNNKILGDLLVAEGDYSLGGVEGQTLDCLDTSNIQAIQQSSAYGPTKITVATLNSLYPFRITFKDLSLPAPSTVVPNDYQVFAANTTQNNTYDANKIEANDIVEFIKQKSQVVMSFADLLSAEREKLVPDFISWISINISKLLPEGQQRIAILTGANTYANAWFESARNHALEFTPENVNSFYKDSSGGFSLASFYGMVISYIMKSVNDQPQIRQSLNDLVLKFRERYTLETFTQRTGKTFLYPNWIENLVAQLKTKPELLNNPQYNGLVEFIAQRQSNRDNASPNGWTIGQYKYLLGLLRTRADQQMKLIGAGIPFTDEEFKNTFTKPIKEKYKALIQNLQNAVERLANEAKKLLAQKGLNTVSQQLIDGLVLSDSILGAADQQMNSNSRTQNVNQGRNQGGAGSMSGRNGSMSGGANYGSGTSDYGTEGRTNAGPNINYPPVSGTIEIDNLVRWAKINGEGGESLERSAFPSLSLSMFDSNDAMKQMFISTFGSGAKAAQYLNEVKKTLAIAIPNWSAQITNMVRDGRKSAQEVREELQRVSTYMGRWNSTLEDAASRLGRL